MLTCQGIAEYDLNCEEAVEMKTPTMKRHSKCFQLLNNILVADCIDEILCFHRTGPGNLSYSPFASLPQGLWVAYASRSDTGGIELIDGWVSQ